MVPFGAGADISAEEALDLLRKLITEGPSVQAVYVGISSLGAGFIGKVFAATDGLILVKGGDQSDGPFSPV